MLQVLYSNPKPQLWCCTPPVPLLHLPLGQSVISDKFFMSWPLQTAPRHSSSWAYQNHCLLPGNSADYWAPLFLINSLGNLYFLPEWQLKWNNIFIIELLKKVTYLICHQDGKLLCLSRLSCSPLNHLPETLWTLLWAWGAETSRIRLSGAS